MFEKAKGQLECLSKLVDTSFMLSTHLQDEPEICDKETQIKYCEEQVKIKKINP